LPLDEVQLVGGLIALIVGVIVIGLLAGGALIADPGNAAPIATAAVGVIGSIVGAYLGIKIGTDGTQKALQAQHDEATRAQVFAAHLSPDKAELALEQARAIVTDRPLPTESREPG
jgi:membrane protein DedA with SNARE-associated domain